MGKHHYKRKKPAKIHNKGYYVKGKLQQRAKYADVEFTKFIGAIIAWFKYAFGMDKQTTPGSEKPELLKDNTPPKSNILYTYQDRVEFLRSHTTDKSRSRWEKHLIPEKLVIELERQSS